MEIAIIGAGAGGLAAALNACHHAHVTLYERNSRAGRKLFCIVVLHSSFLRFSTEI